MSRQSLEAFELNDYEIESLDKYYSLIDEWNSKIDITNITEKKEVYIKHFLDSLLVAKFGYIKPNDRIIDIGTGGGFPGIPLKLHYPLLSVTLLDSLNKRIKFLDEVISVLELDNIYAVHARAEELSRKEDFRERYNIAISRAVAELRTLLEYSMPYVAVGGYFIAMKGPNYKEELKLAKPAIKILGGKLKEVIEYELPEGYGSRTLIIVEKVEPTPQKYPRGQGKPKNKPLT